MTQGNFMPQSLMDKPKKKSNKLLWLIPVFGLLFLMLGGAGFGFYLWQKNRAATTANTNATVANTSNTTNVQTLVETNSKSSPEPETVAEQGDQTGDTNTATTVKPTDTKKTIVSRPPPEPPRKTTTTTTTVATRPPPKPVVKTTTPPRKAEGAIPLTKRPEGAAPRP